jgi:hypothetical protein
MKRKSEGKGCKNNAVSEFQVDKGTDDGSPLQSQESQYIHYVSALKILSDRLGTTPGELAVWGMMGWDFGGLDVYRNPKVFGPFVPLHYQGYFVADYGQLMVAWWFLLDQVKNFKPTHRYISSSQLIERWAR